MKKKHTKTDLQKELSEVVQKEAIDYLKNLRPQIKQILTQATLSLIGIRKSNYGARGYEIDHFNGRNSVLIDAFRNIAIEEVEQLARTYKPAKEDVARFKKAFATEYKSEVNRALNSMARQRAQEKAGEIFDQLNVSVADIVNEAAKSSLNKPAF